MYIVRRTMYDIHCAAYNVRCTLCGVQCTYVHCAAYNVRRNDIHGELSKHPINNISVVVDRIIGYDIVLLRSQLYVILCALFYCTTYNDIRRTYVVC